MSLVTLVVATCLIPGTAEPVASAETPDQLAEPGDAVEGRLAPVTRPYPWH
ncbi:hypothetical protein O7626_38750 [Micromonospora sp. WMMD1102]|uniref:hypothetical protein n=1 Tax=Micromonospora sp. WMMD1102 TaxID=3016105 RepID=UPI00241510D3|nr:hypothetical protein [Micromonospora sp. WMMD1102]MDG4791763.1 hypothetical protein [Micromonospora sp. WMMD1102]